jgi:phosphotransferase system enzyme I (PtsI)
MHKGIAVSPGVAVGVIHRLESPFGPAEPQRLAGPEAVPAEVARLERALARAAAELEQLVRRVGERVGEAEAEIFRTHLSLLRDPALVERVRERIRGERYTAATVLRQVVNEYAAAFARLDQEHFRERLADIRDVIARVVHHLEPPPMAGEAMPPKSLDDTSTSSNGHESIILVADEILPSQAMSLGELPIAAIVTETGGSTSHAAILSRSRGIAAVSGCVGITAAVKNGDLAIVDGREGVVLVQPDPETLAAYRKVQREYFHLRGRLVANRDKPAVSGDGVQVELLANINNLSDVHAASAVGATGIGLFRTEYLFITHPDVPDEQEQYESYRRVIEAAPNQTVTIRTLDLGGDKTVPYLGNRDEANPFMGWRSIRLASEHPRLFETQIRAILRAGRHGNVSMLFPMITTLEELRAVNSLVETARKALKQQRVPYAENVKTGVMVEVPAAAVCIDALVRETDFISIGSNDLIQYLVAADRDNPKVAHLCDPLSPAVLRVLHLIFEACRRTGTPVTVCGEMAGQPRSALALFGLGLRRFSMSPAFIPTTKELLASVTTAEAERFAHQVLQLKTSEEVRKYLNARIKELSKELELFDIR